MTFECRESEFVTATYYPEGFGLDVDVPEHSEETKVHSKICIHLFIFFKLCVCENAARWRE